MARTINYDINEQKFEQPWQVANAPSNYIQVMLKAIIGVKLTISKIAGKRKLSQNKLLADQQGIAKAPAESELTNAKQLAKMILDNN